MQVDLTFHEVMHLVGAIALRLHDVNGLIELFKDDPEILENYKREKGELEDLKAKLKAACE